MYSNFQSPVRDHSTPICCFLSVNLSIVGPQGPVYLHQRVKLKWVLSAKYEKEADTIKCEFGNQILFYFNLKEEHYKPHWIKTQHRVTADGIVIDKNLMEDDEGVYRCTIMEVSGLSTHTAYNLTASGKSAQ